MRESSIIPIKCQIRRDEDEETLSTAGIQLNNSTAVRALKRSRERLSTHPR